MNKNVKKIFYAEMNKLRKNLMKTKKDNIKMQKMKAN